jgi:uncharacterized metal-binding protein YceD (DUF177 family)
MTQGLPLSHSYNLARLGNAGDDVHFAASETERAAVANWVGIVSVEKLDVKVQIKKLECNRFGLAFELAADVTQSCVVSLEPVPGKIARAFNRELVFVGAPRHRPAKAESEVVLEFNPDEGGREEDGPEEIASLHLDLAGPALEEFVLSLEPYPRKPGVEFTPKTGESDPPESPFAVLKGLK